MTHSNPNSNTPAAEKATPLSTVSKKGTTMMKMTTYAALGAILMTMFTSAASAAVVMESLSFTQGSFDDFHHRKGYDYGGSDWDNDDEDLWEAAFNLKYSVETTTGVYTLISGSFTIDNGSAVYNGTINVNKKSSGHAPMYVSDEFLVIDLYDEDGVWATAPTGGSTDAAFSGDEVNNVKDNGGALSKTANSAAGGADERRFLFYIELDEDDWGDSTYLISTALDTLDIDTIRMYVGWEGWDDFDNNRSPLQTDGSPGKVSYNTNASGKFPAEYTIVPGVEVPTPTAFAGMSMLSLALVMRRRRRAA